MSAFGDNLRKLRKSRGYSQERFASEIGSNQVNISSWELGTRMPNLQTIKHIAECFHVPLTTLISAEDTGIEEDFVREVADALQRDSRIRLLFDRTRYMTSSDLDAVVSVVNAITRERVTND